MVSFQSRKYHSFSETQNILNSMSLELKDPPFKVDGDASVLGSYGDTSVLATVIINKKSASQSSLFSGGPLPMTVDYIEQPSAAGKMPWFNEVERKDRKFNEEAILVSRAVDRSLRPCFAYGLQNDMSINIQILSCDLW